MNDIELSILIPARSEEFLARTIEDLIANSEAKTEIIAVLDGQWAEPAIPQHPMVNVIYVPKAIGQRAATNMACRLARGKYVAKVDAHCMFDKGFDRKLLEGFKQEGDNVVMVPVMKNLWAFDWKCLSCGLRTYQGPTKEKCEVCGGKNIKRKMVWLAKDNLTKSQTHKSGRGPTSVTFCFDSEPHFQYFNEFKERAVYKEQLKTGLTETMSIQGSFFMCTREKYWELLSEDFGSWGNQGIQVATAFWLSGGRVLCNQNTWYAHLFRTQGGDFGFPYKQNEKEIKATKKKIKDQVFNNKIPGQTKPLIWLLDKFWPVKGWTEAQREKIRQIPFTK